jgi:methylase of polypeptide subunit release factors
VTVAPAADEALLAALGERLAAVGYDERAVGALLTAGGGLGPSAGRAVLHLRADADGPLPVLVRLFHVGEAVDSQDAAAALAPLELDALEQAGLIDRTGSQARALARLDVHDGLLLASDRDDCSLRPDHVVPVGPATRTVVQLTVRRPAGSALDLGAGSGTHALLAARHCERVVGTDLNPRALRFAALNSALNGAGNVEWRAGDLFAPVRGETFDLIVANPPFVVSPDRALVYRDGGGGRDEMSHAVVSGAAQHLREGGFATVLCSWVSDPDEPWADAPRRWVDGSDCDAWLLHYRTDDPVSYAAIWSEPGRAFAQDRLAASVREWLEHYRRSGVEAISTGAIVLRRRAGRSWVRTDEIPLGLSGPASEQILNVFEAGDFLAAAGDERALLREAIAPAAGARLLQRADFRDGRLEPERVRLALSSGIRLTTRLPAHALPVLRALDGSTPLAAVFAHAATASGVSAEALTAECLPALRELYARGLLVRTDGAGLGRGGTRRPRTDS